MIYFDCAATTIPTEEVIQDIIKGMREDWYNPSSVSEESRRVKLKLQHAREQVADYINCDPEEIIFTSGGSESNNLAIRGFYDNPNNKPYGLFCSKGEHPSIYNLIKRYKDMFYYAYYLPLTKEGTVDLEELNLNLQHLYSPLYSKSHISFSPLVCLSYVNNETGVINPVHKISKIVHKHGGILLIDAVQAIGYQPIDVKNMGIDMLSVSFHKFGGVRGCGFLYVNKNIELNPLIYGGHQENNLRAGTEASYLITAMGNRLQKMKEEKDSRINTITYLRNYLINKLFEDNFAEMWINDKMEKSCTHIVSLTIKDIPAQQLVALMNIDGVIISAGSACSSGEEEPSRILKAIGLNDEEAKSTIRISFDEYTTEKDIDVLIEALKKNVDVLHELHEEDTDMNK